MDGAFYLNPNGTNLFLKPMVPMIIGYSNQAFLSQVGGDISKDTAMDIMDEVKRTANTLSEGVEEDSYIGRSQQRVPKS